MPDKKVNFNKIDHKILNVNFDVTKLETIKFNLKVKDDLKFKNSDDKKIYLEFSRNVSFDEKNSCGIKILFQVTLEMDDEAIKHFDNDEDKLKKFIEKNKDKIANDSRSGADSSLIIAQLTSFLDGGALILPPYFIDEDTK